MVICHFIYDERQIYANCFAIGAGTGTAFTEGNVVVGQSCGNRIRLSLFLRFAHQFAEGGQRCQLAIGEKSVKVIQTILLDLKCRG